MGWDLQELYDREETGVVLFEDLVLESQQAVVVFNMLPDKIDGAAIGWYGKDFSCLQYFMHLNQIHDEIRVFKFILVCLDEQSKYLSREREKTSRKK